MQESSLVVSMACMTSGASSVTLQSLYWRSSDNFSVPVESSRVNWCSPARRLEDEILESRSPVGLRDARIFLSRINGLHDQWSEFRDATVALLEIIGQFFCSCRVIESQLVQSRKRTRR